MAKNVVAKSLADYFSVNRRYARSINLERDLESPEAVLGYVPTERAVEALKRMLAAITHQRPTRAWTLTGVYGTGKSAFAHYLAALCAPKGSPMRCRALGVAEKAFGVESAEYEAIAAELPGQGLIRAVATGQREPLGHTIVRALEQGVSLFWKPANRPEVAGRLLELAIGILEGKATVSNQQVLELVREVAKVAKTDVLIIIDELGKNLEFAAHHPASEDLYLLQQLAELPKGKGAQVYLVGLLHQSFADYSQRLASAQRNEWAKIQGRFEDIPFNESAEQMTRLIGQAIDRSEADSLAYVIHTRAKDWNEALRRVGISQNIPAKVLENTYPLHPVTALVLPLLCTRYAQNDRSLFTFLTSAEPASFQNFLQGAFVKEENIPTLKPYQIYDYFVESVGTNLASRPNLQRWTEIHGLIADATHLDTESLQVLKTIGILNLVTVTGSLRANPALVTLAMLDNVTNRSQQRHWKGVLDQLLSKGVVAHRKQVDELRLWEGSDFDVEAEVVAIVEKERASLVKLLSGIYPLKPLVAQRHSYQTGTIRYFERRYIDASDDLKTLSLTRPDYDGFIGYWLDENVPENVPTHTSDGKPLVLLEARHLELLEARSLEFFALNKIQAGAVDLKNDGVARREVRYRLSHAKQLLDEALKQSFEFGAESYCWIEGTENEIIRAKDFQARLSELCDRVYSKGLVLWNELINRRELTTQGAKARRVLIEMMLQSADRERLGLEGHGPEVSMYASLLQETRIHRCKDEVWGFYPPTKAGVKEVWKAIAQFCLATQEQIQTLDHLYNLLEASPYGMKRGAIPVLLAAVLLHHADDVSVYKDGVFVPVLGAEHFELLVKNPARYAVKYVGVQGLRAQVFRELEAALRGTKVKAQEGRNATLLSVVKPLFQFVRKLPPYTLKTRRISLEAQAVVQAILQAQEPDKLLFLALPKALGVAAIAPSEAENLKVAKALCEKLVRAVQEIQGAYDRLMQECRMLLLATLAISGDEAKLREELRVRSRALVNGCVDPLLRRFTLAAVEESTSDREWLEALVMIVADKPAESWIDEDLTRFEVRLGELARKFKNLAALRTDVDARLIEWAEARRITVTNPNEQEISQVVWMDRRLKDLAGKILAEMSERHNLSENRQLWQVLAVLSTEQAFQEEQAKVKPLKAKPKLKQRKA